MKEVLSIAVVLQLVAWVSFSSLNAIYFQSNFTFWWKSFCYFLLCFLATKTWRKNRTKYTGRLKLLVELQVSNWSESISILGKISSANSPFSAWLPCWLGFRVHFLLWKISSANFRFSTILPCWLTSLPLGTTNLCINWLASGLFASTWTSAESYRNYWLSGSSN